MSSARPRQNLFLNLGEDLSETSEKSLCSPGLDCEDVLVQEEAPEDSGGRSLSNVSTSVSSSLRCVWSPKSFDF